MLGLRAPSRIIAGALMASRRAVIRNDGTSQSKSFIPPCLTLFTRPIFNDSRLPKLDIVLLTAQTALEQSCYKKIDWKIGADELVSTAVSKMAANNIGALAVVEQHGDTEIIGIFSERDYLHKIAALNRDHAKTTIREVATIGATDLVIVEHDELIEGCMKKMLSRGIRHLLVRQDKLVTGMISVKDVVVCAHLKETAMGTHLKETDNRRPCMAIS